ncbi:hypothetical protein FPV67DRAFT_1673277 [Lyophyllum atratum]|nr:hypothetical protein FPV67DRAFT_1673277 [Lyophyllum atratum]
MSSLNLSQAISSLSLPETLITHAYLVGSRLWGTNTESSDFDLLLIADSLSSGVPKSQHKNQYDVTLLTNEEFVARMQGGHLIETVCCLLGVAEQCVLREGESMRHLVQEVPVINEWIASRLLIDREKAKKFWAKGKRKDAFKVLQHMIVAKYVVQGLNGKVKSTGGQLRSISLTMDELHGFVQRGTDESDWTWLNLGWEEVEELHTIRLQGVS